MLGSLLQKQKISNMFVIEKMLQKGSYGMLITLLQGKPIRLAEEGLGMSGKRLK